MGVALVSACASPAGYGERADYAPRPRGYQAAPTARPTYGVWTRGDYLYRIAAGDELSLRFLVNPDLNAQVIVGPDGRGVFPLISALKVEGLTVEEANDALTREYATALRQPQVQAMITAYGSAQIYVGGEVKTPGVHAIKGQMTVAQAVFLAGGFAETARTGEVVVVRQRPGDGQVLLRTVNVRGLLTKGGSGGDFAILPGDLVFVPRSAIAEVDLFVKQWIDGVLPFSRSYSFGTTKN